MNSSRNISDIIYIEKLENERRNLRDAIQAYLNCEEGCYATDAKFALIFEKVLKEN